MKFSIRRGRDSGTARGYGARSAARKVLLLARGSSGQTVVEYLLMTLMLLFLFTGLYRVLQNGIRQTFQKAGRAILYAYQ